MSAVPPFHREFLRSASRKPRQDAKSATALQVSRRDFLSLSAGSVAAAALPGNPGESGFRLERRGQAIAFVMAGQDRWVVDPRLFGPQAELTVEETAGSVALWLANAVFPGTSLAADFVCDLKRAGSHWAMNLRMASGLSVRAEFLSWLAGYESASGIWLRGNITLGPHFRLEWTHDLPVHMTTGWNFVLAGDLRVHLGVHCPPLSASGCSIALADSSSLHSATDSPSTSFTLERGVNQWAVNLKREARAGWSMTHAPQENFFQRLFVETQSDESSFSQKAALLSGEASHAAHLHLLPGGGLLDDLGDPLAIPLHQLVAAFDLDGIERPFALVARMAVERFAAHGADASYTFAPAADAPHVELMNMDAGPLVRLDLKTVCLPGDDACHTFDFTIPHRTRFTWARAVAPFERFFHLWPHTQQVGFPLEPDGHTLTVERPSDMVSLKFQFSGMELRVGAGAHLHPLKDQTPKVTVIFPPQHVAEQAYFHNDDKPLGNSISIGPAEYDKFLPLRSPAQQFLNAQKFYNSDKLDVPASPPPVGSEQWSESTRPAKKIFAGHSRLVFDVSAQKHGIPIHIESLLSWEQWKPIVPNAAKIADKHDPLAPPRAEETAIELPWHLQISPSDLGRWKHAITPQGNGTGVNELWHTRLAVVDEKNALLVDEKNAKDRTIRAVWSLDAKLATDKLVDHPVFTFPDVPAGHPEDPFRMAMDTRDRQEIVHLTSDYTMPARLRRTPDDTDPPLPVQVERLMLTPLGGYLTSHGAWNPGKLADSTQFLTVEEWRHIATLGRDQYVRVVYKGFLMPFGHHASLVKVTERRFYDTGTKNGGRGILAVLHQRMFIVVRKPVVEYPVLGQPAAGKKLPFIRVEAVTQVTPDLDDPNQHIDWPIPQVLEDFDSIPVPWPLAGPPPAGKQSQSLFWPTIKDIPFPFHFRMTDERGTTEVALNVAFVGADVAQRAKSATGPAVDYGAPDAINFYNMSPWGHRKGDFAGQSIAYAPSAKPGDTQYETKEMTWLVEPLADTSNTTSEDLYRNDLPFFFPRKHFARINSSAVRQITGETTYTNVQFSKLWIDHAFDTAKNPGEVLLQVADKAPRLQFGVSGQGDKSGAILSPDIAIVGFSRKAGPVGGSVSADINVNEIHPALQILGAGAFNPAEFFGGLTSAKILGGIKLIDILKLVAPDALCGLDKAPKMVEHAIYKVDSVLQDLTTQLLNFQAKRNPLTFRLSAQAAVLKDAQVALSRAEADEKTQEGVARIAGSLNLITSQGRVIGAMRDYASALERILENPKQLAEEVLEEALLRELAPLEADVIAAFNSLKAAIDNQILDALARLSVCGDALNKKLDQKIAIAINAAGATQIAVQQTLRDVAPPLGNLLDAINAADDGAQHVKHLSGLIAGGDFLHHAPAALSDLNSIFVDMDVIAARVGSLGISTAAARAAVRDILVTAQAVWNDLRYDPVPKNILAKVAILEEKCVQLASISQVGAQCAKDVLQNLRTIQRAADALLLTVQKTVQCVAGVETCDFMAQFLRLRKQERDLLAAMAALQNLLDGLPTPAVPLAAPFVADIQKAISDLSNQLGSWMMFKAASPLRVGLPTYLENPVRKAIKALPAEVSSILLGPMRAIDQRALAAYIALELKPTDIKLLLRFYDAVLEYQSLLDPAELWRFYMQAALALPAVEEAFRLYRQAYTGVQQQVHDAICALEPKWDLFRIALLKKVPSTTGIDVTPIVDALIHDSLDTVSKAFAAFCAGPLGETFFNGKALLAAFIALLNDIRKKIGSLPAVIANAVEQAALDTAKAEAKILLQRLLDKLPIPTSLTVEYDWHPQLTSAEPVFLLSPGADLQVHCAATLGIDPSTGSLNKSFEAEALLTHFSINLIGSPSFVIVHIDEVRFTAKNGHAPEVKMKLLGVELGEALNFVKPLQAILNPKEGPFLEISSLGVRAGYRLAIPDTTVGAFSLMQLALEVAVSLPFTGDPARCQFSISSQEKPFLLSCGIYGGGGFLALHLGLDGVEKLEGALEFGVVAAISIGPLTGSGFLVAGIYFSVGGGTAKVCGFVHAHGHMDIFGIISMDVDLYVSICYVKSADGKSSVYGKARFYVNVHILFFSATYHLEAEYGYAGGGDTHAQMRVPLAPPHCVQRSPVMENQDIENSAETFVSQADWSTYFAQFAEVETTP